MPQIAQQDYYKIVIVDPSNPTDDEKKEIREKIEQGIIFDCLFILGLGNVISRVVSYDMNNEELTVIYEGENVLVSFVE